MNLFSLWSWEPWTYLAWWQVALPPEHGFLALEDRRIPLGLLLWTLLKLSRFVLLVVLCLIACLSQGPCLWPGKLKGTQVHASRDVLVTRTILLSGVMLKKLRCEIIIDQDLLKAWTTELMSHWIIFLSSFHLIFLCYAICVWIYCSWKVPDNGYD